MYYMDHPRGDPRSEGPPPAGALAKKIKYLIYTYIRRSLYMCIFSMHYVYHPCGIPWSEGSSAGALAHPQKRMLLVYFVIYKICICIYIYMYIFHISLNTATTYLGLCG